MSTKRGPKPKYNSIKSRSIRKAFYVDPLLWDKLSEFSDTKNVEKSLIINEGIQMYLASKLGNRSTNERNWTVTSLFSGCGGMDLGFMGGFNFLGKDYPSHLSQAGKSFKLVFASDIMKEACKEYRHYFGQRDPNVDIVQHDIKEYLDLVERSSPQEAQALFPTRSDVVIGGFPCQDFSIAGKRKGLKSERGQLYQQMKRAILLLNPKIFVAENVKGLTNLGEALDVIKADFSDTGKHGYSISSKLHHAADFGVPQTRERVFIIGIRKDLDHNAFTFPLETHSINPEETGLKPWVTAKEAINDLINRPELPNQDQYSKAKNYGEHCQGNRKIKANAPAPTIRAEHHGNIEFHYSQPRRLTIRECARIQSFPDDFKFINSPSAAYKVIGNAVPPVLAWHIASSVAKALQAWETNSNSSYAVKQLVS